MSTLFVGRKGCTVVQLGVNLKKCDVRHSQTLLLTAYLQQIQPRTLRAETWVGLNK